MRPINSRNFGSDVSKIRLTFHNGTSVVSGYIVKQLGARSFLVAAYSDPSTTYKVSLAQTTATATSLTAGLATIVITPFGSGAEHIINLQESRCFTAEGNSYWWVRASATVTGEGGLDVARGISAINLSATTIANAAAANTVVGALTSVPTGAALVLSNTGGNQFAIVGGNLVAGSVPTNKTVANAVTVTVTGTLDSNTVAQSFTITVT